MIIIFLPLILFFALYIIDKKADISISAFVYKVNWPKTVTIYYINEQKLHKLSLVTNVQLTFRILVTNKHEQVINYRYI